MTGDLETLLEPSKHKIDCPKCSKQGYVSQSCFLNEQTSEDNSLPENSNPDKNTVHHSPNPAVQTIDTPLTPSTINPCQAINPHNKQNYLTIIRNNKLTLNITQ